jgi:hypothetical protein
MKKTEFVKTSIICRLAAAFLLVSFLSMTCQTPDSPEEKPNQGIPKGWVFEPRLDLPPKQVHPLITRTPAVFFLDDEYLPVTKYTERTGLTALGALPYEQTLITSEDGGAEPVVRFFGASFHGRELAFTTVSLSFADKESLFPYKAQVIQRRGTEEYTANMTFSAYDPDIQTFSLVYENEGRQETLTSIVLNNGVFNTYQFRAELSESENIRMRNALVAMALWTALKIEWNWRTSRAVLPGLRFIEITPSFIPSSPGSYQAFAVRSDMASILETTLTTSAEAVAAGAAEAAGISPALFFAPAFPEPIPAATGLAGGTLIDNGNSGLAYNLEVIPYTADTTLTFSQARALNPTIGGYSDWRLPTLDELYRIYSLSLYGMITLSSFSPLATTEGWLWTSTGIQSQNNPAYAWALNLGIQATGDNFNQNFRSSDQSSYLAACLVRVVD